MPILQQAQGRSSGLHGGDLGGLAGLRRQLADPSSLSVEDRQRLLELATRLARVQALGDG
jgi:hypothetical protein